MLRNNKHANCPIVDDFLRVFLIYFPPAIAIIVLTKKSARHGVRDIAHTKKAFQGIIILADQ